MPDTSLNAPHSDNWYASWFDSPYYHILYKDRDYSEAQLFMDNLTQYLNLPEQAHILDLACGKGRHSVYLNTLGYRVTGADLSENSINQARQHETDTLDFVRHDMREPFARKFDAVFNLFTSFGYFDAQADDERALLAMHDSLNEFGFGVIDFMNASKVVNNLVPSEEKTVDGITFKLKRFVEGNDVIKEIRFSDAGQDYFFTEKVRAYTLEDFEAMMSRHDIYLLDIFGDYKLRKFHPAESDRLIMIFK